MNANYPNPLLLFYYWLQRNWSFYEEKNLCSAFHNVGGLAISVHSTKLISSSVLRSHFATAVVWLQYWNLECVLILFLYHLWYLQFRSPLKISPRELTWCKLSKMITRGISTALFSLLHWSARLDRYWRSSCEAHIKKRREKKEKENFHHMPLKSSEDE